jgi:hypothetical protein
MKRIRISPLAALCAGLACTDPIGPGPGRTEIVVTVDWSVAQHTGFVDARWQLIRYAAGSDWEIAVDSGDIGTDGSTTIRFHDDCVEERDISTTHRIGVSGHFAAHERSSLPECEFMPVSVRCTSTPQTLGIEGGSPAEACEPPDEATRPWPSAR